MNNIGENIEHMLEKHKLRLVFIFIKKGWDTKADLISRKGQPVMYSKGRGGGLY